MSMSTIIGGIIIGVAQHGMDFADAGKTYTLLTVGDGLVTQIPALIISVAAGLLVTKAGVDARFLDVGKVEKIGGDKVKQVSKVRNGIEIEQSKKIQQIIKGSKIKVQAAIQGDAVRVTGGKRDDLQAAMALIKSEISEFPLSFNNFRD